jgi:SAM-dependent methyltransferase
VSCESADAWSAVAAGWARRHEQVSDSMRPVTDRLLAALDPQPGDRVLEIGGGLGEVGEAVARLVGPDGEVVVTDVAPAMLEAAAKRIGKLPNLSTRVADATETGFEPASFDRAVGRFVVMLVPDPAAALGELRRVLRPDGRLAFAVWTTAPENPWGSTIGQTLLRLGLVDPPEPDSPGPFRLADPERLRSLVRDAGFAEPVLETVDIEMRYDSPDHYVEVSADLSRSFQDALARLSSEDVKRLHDEVKTAIEPFAAEGSVALPGRAWVVAADAT